MQENEHVAVSRGRAPARAFLSLALRSLAAIALLVSAYFAATSGVAAWYARKSTGAGYRQAIRWDPSNPQYYFLLSRFLKDSLGARTTTELIALDGKAVRLGPNRPAYWLELGGDAEWAGHNREARNAYARALIVAPQSPNVNWEAGNFYLLRGETVPALRKFRAAIAADPSLRKPGFELAWRATSNAGLILRELIPPDKGVLFDYLDYLARAGRLDAAAQVWQRILESPIQFATADAFGYLDALLFARRADELSAAWKAMVARHLDGMPGPSARGNLITDGRFESEILGGGLDWRVVPIKGAEVKLDTQVGFDGTKSLEILFDGRHNVDYHHVYQFVPVQPDTPYRFRAYIKTDGITTDSGIHFYLADYYNHSRLALTTPDRLGTSGWAPETLEFRTGPDTNMLILAVVRVRSNKFDNRIAGRCWIDDVSLIALH